MGVRAVYVCVCVAMGHPPQCPSRRYADKAAKKRGGGAKWQYNVQQSQRRWAKGRRSRQARVAPRVGRKVRRTSPQLGRAVAVDRRTTLKHPGVERGGVCRRGARIRRVRTDGEGRRVEVWANRSTRPLQREHTSRIYSVRYIVRSQTWRGGLLCSLHCTASETLEPLTTYLVHTT